MHWEGPRHMDLEPSSAWAKAGRRGSGMEAQDTSHSPNSQVHPSKGSCTTSGGVAPGSLWPANPHILSIPRTPSHTHTNWPTPPPGRRAGGSALLASKGLNFCRGFWPDSRDHLLGLLNMGFP